METSPPPCTVEPLPLPARLEAAMPELRADASRLARRPEHEELVQELTARALRSREVTRLEEAARTVAEAHGLARVDRRARTRRARTTTRLRPVDPRRLERAAGGRRGSPHELRTAPVLANEARRRCPIGRTGRPSSNPTAPSNTRSRSKRASKKNPRRPVNSARAECPIERISQDAIRCATCRRRARAHRRSPATRLRAHVAPCGPRGRLSSRRKHRSVRRSWRTGGADRA